MVLLILKIIGIILLLILFILFLLVFVPWHIRFDTDIDNTDIDISGSLSSGLCFFKAKAFYDNDFTLTAYIFWGLFKIYDTKNKGRSKTKIKRKKKSNKHTVKKHNSDDNEMPSGNPTMENSAKTKKIDNSGIKHDKGKKAGSVSKIIEKVTSFLKKINNTKSKIAIKKIIKIIKKFLKHLHLKMNGTGLLFSLGEPDLTGIATGVVSWIPIIYTNGTTIQPDFISDRPFVRGHIKARGSIMILWVLILLLDIFTDKDIKAMLNNLEEKNG
jgi:hypothetical protein